MIIRYFAVGGVKKMCGIILRIVLEDVTIMQQTSNITQAHLIRYCILAKSKTSSLLREDRYS